MQLAQQSVQRLPRDPDHAGQIGLGDAKRYWAMFRPVFPLKMHECREPPPQPSIGRALLDVRKRAHQDRVSLENQLGEIAEAARVLAAQVTTIQAAWCRIALRAVGSWVAAAGLLMLGWLARP